jgi:hypothetical protein
MKQIDFQSHPGLLNHSLLADFTVFGPQKLPIPMARGGLGLPIHLASRLVSFRSLWRRPIRSHNSEVALLFR